MCLHAMEPAETSADFRPNATAVTNQIIMRQPIRTMYLVSSITIAPNVIPLTAWSPAEFDHNQTQFALTGAHKTIDCSACHSQGFAGTPMDCYSCHQSSYNNSTNPNHAAAGISTECQDCHTTTAFIPSTFDHTATGFELSGRHTTLDCSSCHQGSTSNAEPGMLLLSPGGL